METNIIVDKLNILLADLHVLYQKTRLYHWNVTGPAFNELHKLFQDHYETLYENIDLLAEYIRTLEAFPTQSYKEILEISTIKEDIQRIVTSDNMLQNLIEDHISIMEYMDSNFIKVKDFEDLVTQDIIMGHYEAHSKMLWFLKSSQDNQNIIQNT